MTRGLLLVIGPLPLPHVSFPIPYSFNIHPLPRKDMTQKFCFFNDDKSWNQSTLYRSELLTAFLKIL
jgi:hypothetical protein